MPSTAGASSAHSPGRPIARNATRPSRNIDATVPLSAIASMIVRTVCAVRMS